MVNQCNYSNIICGYMGKHTKSHKNKPNFFPGSERQKMRVGTERAEAWQKEGKKEIMKNWPTKEAANRKQLNKRKGKRLRQRRTKEEHKTVNGINAAAQKKGEQKRMNKRVRELTKETVGVSDSSECGKIWNTQWQNMKEWLKHKGKTERVWREG